VKETTDSIITAKECQEEANPSLYHSQKNAKSFFGIIIKTVMELLHFNLRQYAFRFGDYNYLTSIMHFRPMCP